MEPRRISDPIRIELRIDRSSARRALVIIAAVAVLGAAGLVFAVPVPIPDSYDTGKTLTKAQLDANFGAVEERLAALEAAPSEIWVSTVGASSAAFGSVNTKIYYYTVVEKSVGTAITRSSSSTLGDAFTINEDGVYAMTITGTGYSTGSGGDCGIAVGVSLNAAGGDLTTSILSLPLPQQALGSQSATPCNMRSYPSASVTLTLSTDDVVRPHGDGNSAEFGGPGATFRIVKVSR